MSTRHDPAAMNTVDNTATKTAITAAGETLPSINAERIAETVRQYADASISGSTRRHYQTHIRQFMAFAGLDALPATPEQVALYIGYLGSLKKSVSTINQAMCAINAAHRQSGLDSPTDDRRVRKLMKGARNNIGVAPRKKTAITMDMLDTMISGLDRNTLSGKRDAAILLIGFAGAFRRSELSALNVEDIERTTGRDGRPYLAIAIRKSKTDQEGKGMTKAIVAARDAHLCPIRALDDWLSSAGIDQHAIFRRVTKGDTIINDRLGDGSIATVVKRAARQAGLDESLDFAAHSLRSGFITTAVNVGALERQIANQTGHRSMSVLRGYIQRFEVINDNAVTAIFG